MLNLIQVVRGRPLSRVRRLRPVRPSKQVEVWYRGQLATIVDSCKAAVKNEVLPNLKAAQNEYAYTQDKFATTFAQNLKKVRTALNDALEIGATTLSTQFVGRQRKESEKRFGDSVKQVLGVDLKSAVAKSPRMEMVVEQAIQANVSLIKSIPSQFFDRVEQSVLQNTMKGWSYSDLANEILNIGGITERRAELIARDQTGSVNAAITEDLQTAAGIEQYEWSTSNDERVRDEHADFDGEIFDWDKPPPDGHPGQAINCRCVAIPILTPQRAE